LGEATECDVAEDKPQNKVKNVVALLGPMSQDAIAYHGQDHAGERQNVKNDTSGGRTHWKLLYKEWSYLCQRNPVFWHI